MIILIESIGIIADDNAEGRICGNSLKRFVIIDLSIETFAKSGIPAVTKKWVAAMFHVAHQRYFGESQAGIKKHFK